MSPGSSFLVDYMTAMGTSKVPAIFHWWSAMSLMAACVADRVWVDHAGRRLRPNLYILLFGPSGLGKGTAISAAAELGAVAVGDDLFYGRTTPEGLRDRLRLRQARADGPSGRPTNPRVWLMMEELAFCIGQERGTEFISTLVAAYSGSPVPIRDRTRTGGEIVIPGNVCINLLAGTTREWLQRTLTSDDLAGGFSRRLVVVVGGRDDVLRLAEPIFPDNREALLESLRVRCAALSVLDGPILVSPEARDAFEEWYLGRPPFDDDPGLLPWWDTQDELVYKVATLLTLSEGPPYTLTRQLMEYAQAMTNQIRSWVAEAVVYSTSAPEAKKLAYVRAIIRAGAMVSRRTLQQRCAGQGVLKTELDRYLATLLDTGEARSMGLGPRSGTWYQWIGNERTVPTNLEIVAQAREEPEP